MRILLFIYFSICVLPHSCLHPCSTVSFSLSYSQFSLFVFVFNSIKSLTDYLDSGANPTVWNYHDVLHLHVHFYWFFALLIWYVVSITKITVLCFDLNLITVFCFDLNLLILLHYFHYRTMLLTSQQMHSNWCVEKTYPLCCSCNWSMVEYIPGLLVEVFIWLIVGIHEWTHAHSWVCFQLWVVMAICTNCLLYD